MKGIGVRWTIGDVSERGYAALGLSIQLMAKLLPEAHRVVVVNTVPVSEARARTEDAGSAEWMAAPLHAPSWLTPYLHENYAEGVIWKLAPVRLFPDMHELSLDNDVILWDLPRALREWLVDGDSCLIAEDVTPAFGQFSDVNGSQPRNSGIRGLPPDFDLETALRAMLAERPAMIMNSELDEQGLQVAVVSQEKHFVVPTTDVSICSPFPPHQPYLGECGAHFVGLNAKQLPWKYEGLSGEQHIYRHWDCLYAELRDRVDQVFTPGVLTRIQGGPEDISAL